MENLTNNTEVASTEAQEEAMASEASETITMTREEFELELQKNGDRRISQYQKTLDRKNREAEKLSKMSADEKYQYQLEERERVIAEREHALLIAENKAEISKILADKSLPQAFIDFIVDEDAEVINDRIKLIEREFKKCVRAEVEKRLTQKSPSTSTVVNGLTKEQFKKIKDAKVLAEIKNNDPDLWASLTK